MFLARPSIANHVIGVFVGLSLALILQTKSRFTPSVGFGEIGLAAIIMVGMLIYFTKPYFGIIRKQNVGELLFLGYVVLVLFPLTIIHSYYGTVGTSLRDWLAYLLSATLLLTLISNKIDIKTAVRSTVIFTLLLVGMQYYFGGTDAWISVRFTGGAKNPNQLGLYIVCCMLLIIIADFRIYLKVIFLAVAVFFGLSTLSDAFMVYLAVVLMFVAIFHVVPRKYFPYMIVPVMILFILVLILILGEQSERILNIWSAADEGGSRLSLYTNGIDAWLSSFLSVIIGNGAGSFSGLSGPFQMSEAHNTPIDSLAMGGLIGLFVFYYLVFKNAWMSYKTNSKIIFAGTAGLIIFSLFHFVARQPIYWFTLFAVSEYLWNQNYREIR